MEISCQIVNHPVEPSLQGTEDSSAWMTSFILCCPVKANTENYAYFKYLILN